MDVHMNEETTVGTQTGSIHFVTRSNKKDDAFTFAIRVHEMDNIFAELLRWFPNKWNKIIVNERGDDCAHPDSGSYELDIETKKIKIIVEKWSRQAICFIHFINRTEYDELNNYMFKCSEKNISTMTIFKFSPPHGHYVQHNSVAHRGANLVYNNHVETFEKFINEMSKNSEILRRHGFSLNRNYLLYGPPGTGKTTTIRHLSDKLGLNIYIINGKIAGKLFDLHYLFNPTNNNKNKNEMKLLVFEDFDRYLVNEDSINQMSEILNALDGINSDGCFIRFFTCNNVETIMGDDRFKALRSRLSGIYEYTLPNSTDIYYNKIKDILEWKTITESDCVSIKRISEKIPIGISLRVLENYIIRFMFDDDFIQQIENHLDELLLY